MSCVDADTAYASRFNSLADPGSWVDLPTNYASLAGVELRTDFGLLIQGQYPLRFLSDFIHELTHHWCFQSPVGMALAMLRLETFRDALTALNQDANNEDVSIALLHKIIRYDATTAILRPISEGLALFAEFDIRPGSGSLKSQPMQWIDVFALHNRENPGSESSVLHTLFNARLNFTTVKRKANLLVRSLGAPDRGYLSGYLFVKMLWLHCMEQCDSFVDLDLFLCYVRSYFFEDLGLVDRILAPPDSADIGSANSVYGHVQDRASRLWKTVDLEKQVKDFQLDVLQRPGAVLLGAPPSHRQGILMTDEESRSGTARYEVRRQQLEQAGTEQWVERRLRDHHLTTLQQRQFFVVAREKVQVRRTSSGQMIECVQDGRLLCAVPRVEGERSVVSGEGSVAYIVLPALGRDALSVSLDGKVIAFFSQADLDERTRLDDATRDSLLHYPTDDSAYAFGTDCLEALVTSFTDRGANQGLWKRYVVQRDPVVSFAYSKWATIRIPDTDLDRVTQSLENRGFWERVGADLGNMNDYALLGLCTSLRLIKNADVEYAFERLDRNTNAIAEVIRRPNALPFPIGRLTKDGILAYF